MFTIDNGTIYITRGDVAAFTVSAKVLDTDEDYIFQPGEIVRVKVFERKNCKSVVLKKDTEVNIPTSTVDILLDKSDTKIGDIINKPKDYWYEVEINPDTKPQTITGYGIDGPKIFKLLPEGGDYNG